MRLFSNGNAMYFCCETKRIALLHALPVTQKWLLIMAMAIECTTSGAHEIVMKKEIT
jgi:hypothetical protein